MATKELKPVPGYPNYLVTEDGRVFSNYGQGLRELSPQRAKRGGYLVVQLGRGRTRTVHSLILETFRGPRPKGADIRHLDGDRSNNTLENLAYGTRAENMADAIFHGTTTRGQRNTNARLTESDVREIRRLWAAGGLSQRTIGERFGVTSENVCMIVNRRSWGWLP